MGQVARPLSTNKGLKTPQQEKHNHTMIIQQNLREELLEEEEQLTDNTGESGLSEINIKIRGEVIRTLVDTGSEISVISEGVLDKIQGNSRATFPTLPVAGVTIVGVTGVRSKRVTTQVLVEFELGN